MAELSGTNLASSIVPFTTDDTFATHLAKFGKGGWRSVADITERDGITADRREAGMAVYVVSEKKLYILADDLATWTALDTDSGYTKDEIDGLLAAIEAQIDANADAIQKTREDYAQADADIMTIINAHAEQITTNKNDIGDLGDQVAEIEAKIPESASETNQLVTQTDLTNKKIEIMGEVNETVSELQTQITAQATAIEGKVDKTGDTMTGTLNVPELNVATEEGTINLSITAGTATIATNNGLDIVAQTKFDTAPTTDDTTAWADVNATALVTKQQVTTALAGAGGGGSAEYPDQTDNAGRFLMTDGTDVSWEPAIRNNSDDPDYSLSIGKDSENVSVYSIAMGNEAKSQRDYDIAIGYKSETFGNASIAIGSVAQCIKDDVWGQIAVGNYAVAGETDSIAIGREAKSTANYSVCLGSKATSNYGYSVAIGHQAQASSYNAVVIGYTASTYHIGGQNQIAIGTQARTNANNCIAMGYQALTSSNSVSAISIGQNATVDANSGYGVAIGYNTEVKNADSIAIGKNAIAYSYSQTVVGPWSAATGATSTALGYYAYATADGSVQIGAGENTVEHSLQFRDYTVIREDGTIPPQRLSPEPPAEGFTLVYDGQSDELRWAKVGGGSSEESTAVIIRRWN